MAYLTRSGVFVLAALGLSFAQSNSSDWTDDFGVDRAELMSTGTNPLFDLRAGKQLTLSDASTVLVISVLPATRMIDGVETRVVEERESRGGALVEISRNFFAISRRTNAVYYFGEEVDMYDKGRIIGHEGSWLSGVDGARFGLAMPGQALLRARYYQEIAPGRAMDRAEIVSLRARVVTSARTFDSTIKVEETTPLEPGVKEYKFYVRGVGLVQDGTLKLSSRDR